MSANALNLTNQQQLWLMEQFKKQQLSLEQTEQAASMMSAGQDPFMKKSNSLERPEKSAMKKSDPTKRSEQKKNMNVNFSFTFGVIRFPYGFKLGNGIKNSLQIDFRKQNIYFMDKITIHVIIPFSDVIACSSDENSIGIKLQTKHTKLKFCSNMSHKAEIERLISMIVQRNKFKESPPPLNSLPPETHQIAQAETYSKARVVTMLNTRKVLMEGVIEKKGNAAIVRWAKRFVRVEEREFSYYQPNNKNDPLGVVQIDPSTRIEGTKSDKSTFIITVGKRSYFFRVKTYETPERTEGERNSWLLAFKEACSQKTILKYWVNNRKSFFPQDKIYPGRSPSPPADYDDPDGAAQSHTTLCADIPLTTFKKPLSPTTKFALPNNSKIKEPENVSPVVKKETLPVAPILPGAPRSLGPPPPGPPPPPPPPPPATSPKQPITLKAHCDTKLKHFFVPKVTPKEVKKTAWSEMNDLTARLDMKLLEDYFVESKPTGTITAEAKRSSYMDPKKTQNVLILMKSDIFIQTVNKLQELITSIEPPDENEIDMIRTIQKYQPSVDEVELYQKLMTDKAEFSKADKIMCTLASIPCLQKRLELVLNLWTFDSQYEEFIQFLKQLSMACNEILTSKKFVSVMEYLLAILNLMNTSGESGSATKAFHLKFLSQLKTIQNARGFNLMNMLVIQLKRNSPELLDFHKELNTVIECEDMSVKAVHATIEVLKSDLQLILNDSKKIQSMIKNPTPSESEFFKNIKEFHTKLQRKLDSTVTETDKIERQYNQILVWFGLHKDTSSEDIFKYLTSFMREFIETKAKKT